MANLTITNSSYTGEAAGKYISAALLTAKTLDAGLVDVRENVKYKQVIQKLNASNLIEAASCDFTGDQSGVDMSEIILEPKELMVNLKMCTKELTQNWEAVQMGSSAHDDSFPKNFQDYVIGHVSKSIATSLEQMVWGGSDTATSFAGIATLAAASSDTLKVTTSETSIDADNVTAELAAIVDLIPDALYGSEDLVIAVSPSIFRAYKRALGGFQADGKGANGFEGRGANQDINVQYFDGIPVVMANGLAGNKALAYQTSNIFFGTGLLSDTNEVRVIDQAPIDGSQNVHFVMRFTGGVTLGYENEIVYYAQ